MRFRSSNPRERLVAYVTELERLEKLKREASDLLRDAFHDAGEAGYDTKTLKVVLKLRQMTPEQRRERRALEAIYMAALGMLEGEPLTDEARRRLDPAPEPPPAPAPPAPPDADAPAPDPGAEPPVVPPPPPQPSLPLKTPDEARQEGADAAASGKRVYDNPYPAGDPCRAAWDEGWCSQSKSHGMETPEAYRRRGAKPPDKDGKDRRDPDGGAGGDDDRDPDGGAGGDLDPDRGAGGADDRDPDGGPTGGDR